MLFPVFLQSFFHVFSMLSPAFIHAKPTKQFSLLSLPMKEKVSHFPSRGTAVIVKYLFNSK